MENKQTTLPELIEMVIAADQRAALANNQLLIKSIGQLRTNATQEPNWAVEDRADRELIVYTQRAMTLRISTARIKGRFGWWNNDVCSIQDLRALLYKATLDDDLTSVINYAAMITAREITDKH